MDKRQESKSTTVYWAKRFEKDTPERVKRAIKRVYHSYPVDCMPQGTCDPLYIMNVICRELGVGDGEHHFNLQEETAARHQEDLEAMQAEIRTLTEENIRLQDKVQSLERGIK